MLPTGVRNRISLTAVDINMPTTEIETGSLLYVMLGVANILSFPQRCYIFFRIIAMHNNKTQSALWLDYKTTDCFVQ